MSASKRWRIAKISESDPARPATNGSSSTQLVVLGMHRSGTSLVSQLLASMGCYAGERGELYPDDVWNPRGYWERTDVNDLCEEMLDELGASWIDPLRADPAGLGEAAREKFSARARAIIARLDAHGTWATKNPRMTILFPFWRPLLERPVCVLAWREPAAVSRSIEKRDGFPRSLGVALWDAYTRAMLASTLGLPRVLVAYDELVASPVATVQRLGRELSAAGATGLRIPDEAAIRAIVEVSLNRSAGNDAPLDEGQRTLRDALRDGSALGWGEIPPMSDGTRTLLRDWGPHLTSHEALREEAGTLYSLVDDILGSRSWRLGFAFTGIWRALARPGGKTAIDHWNEFRANASRTYTSRRDRMRR